jgi:hypothetical protein
MAGPDLFYKENSFSTGVVTGYGVALLGGLAFTFSTLLVKPDYDLLSV